MKVKKLYEDAIIPTKGSKYSAGYDLYAHIDEPGVIEIRPGMTEMVGTGIAMEIPFGSFGGVYARSGLASKHGLRPANCVGVVDSDYRGEIMVALHNDSGAVETVSNGDRIAQLVIQPYYHLVLEEADELTDTDRSGGGFGSTGR